MNTEKIVCNTCGANFAGHELIHDATQIPNIASWVCPVCGGGDYDGVDADESIDSDFW